MLEASKRNIVSDATHYGPFICTICQDLVKLEKAVVTSPCSHPYCYDCLKTWAVKQSTTLSTIACPSCQTSISDDFFPGMDMGDTSKDSSNNDNNNESSNTMTIKQVTSDSAVMFVACQLLQNAQPLAYKVLTLVQISCIRKITGIGSNDNNNNGDCDQCQWVGNYAEYWEHANEDHYKQLLSSSGNNKKTSDDIIIATRQRNESPHNNDNDDNDKPGEEKHYTMKDLKSRMPPIADQPKPKVITTLDNERCISPLTEAMLYGQNKSKGQNSNNNKDDNNNKEKHTFDTSLTQLDLANGEDYNNNDEAKEDILSPLRKSTEIKANKDTTATNNGSFKINNGSNSSRSHTRESKQKQRIPASPATSTRRKKKRSPTAMDSRLHSSHPDLSVNASDDKSESDKVESSRLHKSFGHLQYSPSVMAVKDRIVNSHMHSIAREPPGKRPQQAMSLSPTSSVAARPEPPGTTNEYVPNNNIMKSPSQSRSKVLPSILKSPTASPVKMAKHQEVIDVSPKIPTTTTTLQQRHNNSFSSVKSANSPAYVSESEDVVTSILPTSPLKNAERQSSKDSAAKSKSRKRTEASSSQLIDYNMSINSMGGWQAGDAEIPTQEPMLTLEEEGTESEPNSPEKQQNHLLRSPDTEGYTMDAEHDEYDSGVDKEDADDMDAESVNDESSVVVKQRRMIERGEKLKKQANAKFNKGDFTNARTLYTEGITVMAALGANKSDHVKEVLSNMYSNRAVTFFREKSFDLCIEDCDKAIEFDATYEKTWIRKWRALIAMGEMQRAFDCLDDGIKIASSTKKINEVYDKARNDLDVYNNMMEMLVQKEYQTVLDLVKPHIRSADNISLLFVAAKAHLGMGNVDQALQNVNKGLRLNPHHSEGLQLRGFCSFLSGNTEKGIALLQEAYNRNMTSKSLRALLASCTKTHQSMTKGVAYAQRGRQTEAIACFSDAMQDLSNVDGVSKKSPIYAIVRTSRAEAWLLSLKYLEALKDCQEVISSQKECAAAWTIRARILVALGKADDAVKELGKIRRSWGIDNQMIEETYRRADFELRVLKAEDNLTGFVADLERGNVGRLLYTCNNDKVVAKYERSSSVQRMPTTATAQPPPPTRRGVGRQESQSNIQSSDHRNQDRKSRAGVSRNQRSSRDDRSRRSSRGDGLRSSKHDGLKSSKHDGIKSSRHGSRRGDRRSSASRPRTSRNGKSDDMDNSQGLPKFKNVSLTVQTEGRSKSVAPTRRPQRL